ncbi:MAG: DUF4878 domain-containing protein [Bacteroidales bacterium]|nr:DUF4878 domain-containing protein [Bacteroidales bacterium]MCF8344348.1 DUF4878 domain-containing protein [Bacteroidales bacterium]MCF8350919.1 DUF4878 domain-containing protein [Bacteroidales bacterium]MCF8375793.1 DUF4878 domain-containing protein [Bacteroidales bacterium]
MKKLSLIASTVLSVFVLFLAVSCGGGGNSPGKTAEKAMMTAADADAEGFVKLVYMEEGEEISDEDMEQLQMMLDYGQKEIEKKEGLKKVEIISEEVTEDGNEAEVKMKMVYGDESEDEETVKMIKQNGKWKVKMY